MSAIELTQLITHILYLSIFAVTLLAAFRRATRTNVDIALFFGLAAFIILEQRLGSVLSLASDVRGPATTAVAAGLPYALLRLVDDFSEVPFWGLRLAEIGFVAFVVGAFVLRPVSPGYLTLYTLYFLLLTIYASVVFLREGRRSAGVTRRRLQAVGAGSVLLGLTAAAAAIDVLIPVEPVTTLLTQFFALASGVAFYFGFAPPAILRRAWQEPELRSFLAGAARLPRLPDTLAIVREIERGAAAATGASARLALWQETEGVLRFWQEDLGSRDFRPTGFAGKAFMERRAIYSSDVWRDDAESAAMYRERGILSILAAPIVVGERALGVLVVYSRRAPIFGDDDLALAQLLADQAAVVLENRALIDEAARVRAHEEATRLKEDFLSAAAHDLRTPLTTIVTQAQLIQRRAEREPQSPEELSGIRRLVSEARRLNALVVELLDASRAERGKLVGARKRIDLASLVRDVASSRAGDQRRVFVDADGTIEGDYDEARIRQLLDNLIENALKYSPAEGAVRVKSWREGSEARIAVEDRGIGIPPEDVPYIFDRFRRGQNVDDRRFTGMGLGLTICRGIAEQHGGRIWAESRLGRGSTFYVALPVARDKPATVER